MKKINIGLIGCGIVGLRRIDVLLKVFNLIGCADPDIFLKKNKNLKKSKIFLTKNWKSLLNLKNIQAIIISTTHYLHSEIIL